MASFFWLVIIDELTPTPTLGQSRLRNDVIHVPRSSRFKYVSADTFKVITAAANRNNNFFDRNPITFEFWVVKVRLLLANLLLIITK